MRQICTCAAAARHLSLSCPSLLFLMISLDLCMALQGMLILRAHHSFL